MKILFDHQIYYYKYGGAAKYFSKLLQYLPKNSWQCTALHPYSAYLKDAGVKSYEKHFRGDSVILEILNRPYTYYELSKGDYDVYHQTNFSVDCLNHANGKPVVTTYHDPNLCTIDPHPEIVKRQAASLRRADAIICVSENTKKDMLRLFDVDESKVHVIYHGIEDVDISALPSTRVIEDKYILYVGRRSSYKNFNVMAQAFSEVHKHFPELRLVCTMSPFTVAEHTLFQKLNINNSVVYINASEMTMQRLFRDAETFVFPSLYEGFGMPILEAWQCHCPVILSKSSCFPEIAAESALYFDANNYQQLADNILLMISDNFVRKRFVKLGDDRVKKFSWQRCANEHYKLYNSLI